MHKRHSFFHGSDVFPVAQPTMSKHWKNRLIELRFYFPLDTKKVISEMFPKPVSWIGMEKLNLTQSITHSLKELQSSNPNQWPGLILYSAITTLLKEGLLLPLFWLSHTSKIQQYIYIIWFLCQKSTTTTVLQPLKRSTCVSWQPRLRTGGFAGAKFHCLQALADGS